MRVDLYRGTKRALQELGHPLYEFRHVECHELELLTPRKRQHSLRQGGAALRTLHRVLKKLRDLGVVLGKSPLQKLKAALNGHQEIVEIVRDPAGEMSDRFHLLRLDQRLARLFQRALGGPALGDVAGDLGKAVKRTVVIAKGVD